MAHGGRGSSSQRAPFPASCAPAASIPTQRDSGETRQEDLPQCRKVTPEQPSALGPAVLTRRPPRHTGGAARRRAATAKERQAPRPAALPAGSKGTRGEGSGGGSATGESSVGQAGRTLQQSREGEGEEGRTGGWAAEALAASPHTSAATMGSGTSRCAAGRGRRGSPGCGQPGRGEPRGARLGKGQQRIEGPPLALLKRRGGGRGDESGGGEAGAEGHRRRRPPGRAPPQRRGRGGAGARRRGGAVGAGRGLRGERGSAGGGPVTCSAGSL